MLLILGFLSCQGQSGDYVCKPCNQSCDQLLFHEPGNCTHCGMSLVKRSNLEKENLLVLNEIDVQPGSGVFLIEGGTAHKEKTIKVYYHRPERFNVDSKILIVIPGAGRNGDSYRDAWIVKSEKYNVLILSPMYPEEAYAFEDYHLGGLIYDLNLENSIEFVEHTNQAKLDEDKFTFKVNVNPNEWIFNDFDRLFDLVVAATNSSQSTYDIFGHSAGGQILHRMAILHQDSKADHILAANAGFYTLPDLTTELPFGIKNLPLSKEHLRSSFRKKLVILNGDLDNQDEQGGTLLRSVTVDRQGLHRLARGKYFHQESKAKAKEMGFDFNWKLKIVPNVGHNHEKIGDAAAKYLYGY